MFHAPNSVNACTAWTGHSADCVKRLTSIFPHTYKVWGKIKGIKHPAFPGHLSKSPRTLFNQNLCRHPCSTRSKGFICSTSKESWLRWELPSFHSDFWASLSMQIFLWTVHPQLEDAGAAPSHAVAQSCSPVESWLGLFGVCHIAVLPNANKKQGLSTAIHSCSLTPQACSTTRNKKWGSNSPHEARIDN